MTSHFKNVVHFLFFLDMTAEICGTFFDLVFKAGKGTLKFWLDLMLQGLPH